jgi:hypothetical protein
MAVSAPIDNIGTFSRIERSGQEYRDEICSRQKRQREYWKSKGKEARRERNSALSGEIERK